MDLGLQDRVIVVTGGAAGIGEAITRACIAEGAAVVMAGRSPDNATSLLRDLDVGDRCEFIAAELADSQQCADAVEHVRRTRGRIDALVNNAGTNDRIGLAGGDPARFLDSLRSNLLHYYAMAHYSLPLLKESQGCILNISSKVALTGQGGTSAYAAAKGAQLALTREWAAELLPFGIRVNSIVPAEVLTPLYRSLVASSEDPAAALEAVARKVPLGHRMTEPSEIAAMALFLLSSRQSGHITAQHVVVDGGYTHLDRALT